jgi:hypothetical protein
MDYPTKLYIYKGMIQYLLRSTNYDLMDIADLSNTPIKSIRSIYHGHQVSLDPLSELRLVKTYYFILELKLREDLWSFHPFGEML